MVHVPSPVSDMRRTQMNQMRKWAESLASFRFPQRVAAGAGAAAATASASETETSFAVKSESKRSAMGDGGDPWWLKNPPWWLPPPPHWGPMPPGLYNEYYRAVKDLPPLSTPNFGPQLYHRAVDQDTPLGQGIPLPPHVQDGKAYQGSDLLPPKEPRPLTAGDGEANPAGPPPNPFVEAGEAGNPNAFIEVATTAAGPAPADALKSNVISGPKTIAEHLPGTPQVIVVPPYLRYDRDRHYDHYWNERYQAHLDNGRPFGYKVAPDYPPRPRQVFDEGAFSRGAAVYKDLPHPRPLFFGIAPKYPSKYDQATVWQMRTLENVKKEWNDPEMEKRLRERIGADITNMQV